MASRTIRRQLGHSLLSSLKYTFTIDTRDSAARPTQGYFCVLSSQIGGLAPDNRCLRFLPQEFDLRYALPLRFYNAALNFGISGGVVFPWGSGFLNKSSSLPERFFLGGDSSSVSSVGWPITVWGFNTRGIGFTERRRRNSDKSDGENSNSLRRDVVGGDLDVAAFADLSFDLPSRWLHGVHGHIFAGSGNVAKLSENDQFRNFSFQKFSESFRSSIGAGVVVPLKFFRLECNYEYILKKDKGDRGHIGFAFASHNPLLIFDSYISFSILKSRKRGICYVFLC